VSPSPPIPPGSPGGRLGAGSGALVLALFCFCLPVWVAFYLT
jgi:hypothetical protein